MFSSPSSVFGDEFNYVCRDDKDSIQVFGINTNKYLIEHLTSQVSPNSKDVSNPGQVFKVYREEKILRWSYPRVWSYIFDKDENLNIREFNFILNEMFIFGFGESKFTDDKFYPPRKYQCFRS